VGAIDECLCEIELPAIAKIFSQAAKDPFERLVFNPRLKSSMAGLIRRISARQVGPRGARSQDPQHAIDDGPCFLPRSTTSLGRTLQFVGGETALDRVPLLIGEVHLQP
jgi:hypothetical protein